MVSLASWPGKLHQISWWGKWLCVGAPRLQPGMTITGSSVFLNLSRIPWPWPSPASQPLLPESADTPRKKNNYSSSASEVLLYEASYVFGVYVSSVTLIPSQAVFLVSCPASLIVIDWTSGLPQTIKPTLWRIVDRWLLEVLSMVHLSLLHFSTLLKNHILNKFYVLHFTNVILLVSCLRMPFICSEF